jgi:hypothetical protein
MRAKFILACLTLGLTLGLTACGGDDDENEGEAKQVADVARQVVLEKDKVCGLLTQAALEVYTRERGEDVKKACADSVKDDEFPESADVTVLSVEDDGASVGYTTDQGLTGAMKLRKVGGKWLMDAVTTIPGP